jgi:anaerobic selenocysteine-containing dehydrogenase
MSCGKGGGSMKITKSTCGFCYAGFGILIHVENGKPAKIEGDPEAR